MKEVKFLDLYYAEPEVGVFIPDFQIKIGDKAPIWITLYEIKEGESYIFSFYDIDPELLLAEALEYFEENKDKFNALVKRTIEFRKKEGQEIRKYVERLEESLNKVEKICSERKVEIKKYTLTVIDEDGVLIDKNHKITNEEFDELSNNIQDLQIKAGYEIGEPPISYWNREFTTLEGEFLYEFFKEEIERIKEWVKRVKRKFYIE